MAGIGFATIAKGEPYDVLAIGVSENLVTGGPSRGASRFFAVARYLH